MIVVSSAQKTLTFIVSVACLFSTLIRGADCLSIGRCGLLGADRCGFFGLRYALHLGEPGTESCMQICVVLPIFAGSEYECGYCDPRPTRPPAIAPAPTPASFEISLDLDIPLADRAIFRRAQDTWTNIITGGLPDVASSSLEGGVLDGTCRYPTIINDVYICCQYIDIDGEGGVVGRTAILATRNDTDGLPIVARIRLDNDDVASLKNAGTLQQVIEHEIAHALGFGILWGSKNLTKVVSGNCEYTGAKAIAEYRNLTGCGKIPTTCGHWKEDCLNRELMTSSLDANAAISIVTIASMVDLGYEVDYSSADSFSKIDITFSCLLQCPARNLNEIENQEFVRRRLDDGSEYTGRHRRLSDKGYLDAVRHGRTVLEQETAHPSKNLEHETIYILYMENDALYSVPVRRD
jgi:hypothetical protein